MNWSRELRIARRSMRTALKAATAITKANARLSLPASNPLAPPLTGTGLVQVTGFGSNPGELAMFARLPSQGTVAKAPLIVLLHGCGQDAAHFLRTTGFAAIADRMGMTVVLPEQSDANNRGRCFNWFRPAHTARGMGEALSIRQMVAEAVRRFGADPARIFVAGLSAGGAMTAALLAAYPDVFAAGAVVAGLPVGSASSVSEALRRMAEAGPQRTAAAWAEEVRGAGPDGYPGPWPRISIWHGLADRVVDPANAALLSRQWSALQGADPESAETVQLLGTTRSRWNVDGRAVVEQWTVPEFAHDWPPGATEGIAAFWGLTPD